MNNIHRLLEVVLRNVATNPDPKYRLLKASNDTLWVRLLQFPEVVEILECAAGFERRTGTQREEGTNVVSTETCRINTRISRECVDSSLQSNHPDSITSLVGDLEVVTLASKQPPANRTNTDSARDFDLYHPGVGGDGRGLQSISEVLQVLTTL